VATVITSHSDDELKALEDQAEAQLRAALAEVMDVLARRLERHDAPAVEEQ
jgi:hypothetical protein